MVFIAPAIRQHYGLTLTQVGVVLAALNFGSLATLLLWGIVADRIGERAVIALGQTGTSAALVWAEDGFPVTLPRWPSRLRQPAGGRWLPARLAARLARR